MSYPLDRSRTEHQSIGTWTRDPEGLIAALYILKTELEGLTHG